MSDSQLSFQIPSLRQLQPSAGESSSLAAFARLVDWLRDAGAQIGPIELRCLDASNRELQAARQTTSGQPLLSIPLRCLITSQLAKDSIAARRLADAGVTPESDHLLVAVHVLHERHDPASFFRPYLDMLPPIFPGVPLLLAPAERELLRGSFILADTDQRQAALRVDFENLCRHVWNGQRYTFPQFLWAYLAASTRLFRITIAGELLEAMVPLADMMNHTAAAEATWSMNEQAQLFIMTATRTLAPRDPIRCNYGQKSNGRFLFNYGFCLADNTHNEAEIALPELPADHPMKAAVKVGRPRADSGLLRFRMPLSYAAGDTRQVFSMLRLLSWIPVDGPVFPLPGPDWAEIPPLNLRNESAALGLLAGACRAALARFPQTLDADLRLLEDPGLSSNARNCILARSSEKRILDAYLELANTLTRLLQSRAALPQPPTPDLDVFSDYLQQSSRLL